MNFLKYDLDLKSEDTVEITLDKQANVRLLDESNFHKYKHGKKHNYFGGSAQSSPVHIKAPHSGRWYLVIDLGGFQGTVRAEVKIING